MLANLWSPAGHLGSWWRPAQLAGEEVDYHCCWWWWGRAALQSRPGRPIPSPEGSPTTHRPIFTSAFPCTLILKGSLTPDAQVEVACPLAGHQPQAFSEGAGPCWLAERI